MNTNMDSINCNCYFVLYYRQCHIFPVVHVLIVDDGQNTPPSVRPEWWIKELKLAKSDLLRLMSGGELTDSLMNAAQDLLAKQFAGYLSFQDVTLGRLLMFEPVHMTSKGLAVQILHTG